MQYDRRALEGPVTMQAETRTVTGYAAVFNSRSNDLGGWFEVIKPGAFAKALSSGQEVRALFNHEPNYVLGSTKSGTLRLSEDDKGLRYEVDLPRTSYASDLVSLLERGDIRGSSFAFLPTATPTWSGSVREVSEVELYDVSIVTSPAYDAATVISVRSFHAFDEMRRSIEHYKRKLVVMEWY
jgi:HK97 family phage prohead protease